MVIAVPPNVVKILRRRIRTTKLRTDVAIFPSPISPQCGTRPACG